VKPDNTESCLQHSAFDVGGLLCPQCRADLAHVSECLRCVSCGETYPISEGVPRFAPADDFYEGKVTHRIPCTPARTGVAGFWDHVERRWSIRHLRDRFFTGLGLEGAKILDVGCGGGSELFARFGEVTGLDISWKSAVAASEIYPRGVQADLRRIPYEDNYFDAVLGQDIFGHIPPEKKEEVIDEMVRVLRPGGKLALLIEGIGKGPLWRLAQSKESLWKRYFIDQDGHYGLETPEQIVSRFHRPDLRIVNLGHAYSLFWRIEDYLARFKNEYRRGAPFLRVWIHACKIAHRYPPAERLADLVLGFLGQIVEPRLIPNHCGAVLIAAEKLKSH